MRIEDRIGEDINRKEIKVEKIERDEGGEIVSIIGEIIRADEKSRGGTLLNAKVLTLIAKKYYVENTVMQVIADGSSASFGGVIIEVFEPVEVEIENQYQDLFSVSYKKNEKEVMIEVFAKREPEGEGTSEYEFNVILTSVETQVRIGKIKCTVVYQFQSTNPED